LGTGSWGKDEDETYQPHENQTSHPNLRLERFWKKE
jgi:hypothetical protein